MSSLSELELTHSSSCFHGFWFHKRDRVFIQAWKVVHFSAIKNEICTNEFHNVRRRTNSRVNWFTQPRFYDIDVRITLTIQKRERNWRTDFICACL